MVNRIFLDIETTGLTNLDNELIVVGVLDRDGCKSLWELDDLIEYLDEQKEKNLPNEIITYNGGTFYNSGFDMPFLRAKLLQANKSNPFMGISHLDLYPIVQKYFNFQETVYEKPSVSSLRKADLVKLAEANEVEYETISKTYETLCEIDETDWLDYKTYKTESKNDLQSIYQTFFDIYNSKEYINGSEIPKLYEEGDLETIEQHVLDDVNQLKQIYFKLRDYVPDNIFNKVREVM